MVMVSSTRRLFGSFFTFFIILSLPFFRYDSIGYTYIQSRLPLSLKYFFAIRLLLSISHPIPLLLSPPSPIVAFVPGLMFVCVMVCLKLDVILFLEWMGGVCRIVGCKNVFQVKAFFARLRSACWKAYRVLYIDQLLLEFVFFCQSSWQ